MLFYKPVPEVSCITVIHIPLARMQSYAPLNARAVEKCSLAVGLGRGGKGFGMELANLLSLELGYEEKEGSKGIEVMGVTSQQQA